jgi:tetratricopeptide (TPR) repeat protein
MDIARLLHGITSVPTMQQNRKSSQTPLHAQGDVGTAIAGTAPALSFDAMVARYEQAIIDAQRHGTPDLLPALLARDAVEAVRREHPPLTQDQAQHLVALDDQLQQLAGAHLRAKLPAWRQSLQPPAEAWWWWLDQRDDLPWLVLATVLVMLMTIPVAYDIIKRVWDGATATVSIYGSLLTLLLTSSLFAEPGKAVGRRMLHLVPGLTLRRQSQAMFGIALLVFVVVVVGRIWGVPALARQVNDSGSHELHQGNIAAAQQDFQHAIHLDPTLPVQYYQLGKVYQQTGFLDTAVTWYRQAIAHDQNFGPAYRELGHLYNLQGKPSEAERILLAGLDLPGIKDAPRDASSQDGETRYQLLADLGWTYFAQHRFDLAQKVLEESEERENAANGAYSSIPLPHFYLAQIYERLRPRLGPRMYYLARYEWARTLESFRHKESQLDYEQLTTACLHLRQLHLHMSGTACTGY